MSVSFSSGIILGLPATELGFKVEIVNNTYEVHDKKGSPTGKFETETNYKLSFGDKEKVYDWPYSDIIDELIKVKSPLSLYNQNERTFKREFNPNDLIVGVEIVNRRYDDWNFFKEIKTSDLGLKIFEVREEIAKQFGLDEDNLDVRLFYYFNAG